jgi:predicted phosphodiesterase
MSRIDAIKQVLGKFPSTRAALPTLSKLLGKACTEDSVRAILRAAGEPSPRHFLKAPAPELSGTQTGAKFARLVELVRKPIGFAELCDRLDLSPNKTREMILQARAEGIKVRAENDHVGIHIEEPIEKVQPTRISPVVGQRQRVGVISDTHLGSKYCMRDQLVDFVHYAYEQGVREILHPGDVLDGQYRHGVYEVTHVGIDEQSRDLFETLPALPGLTYHGITGNHDNTFTESSGVDAGEFIEGYFRKHGRQDFKFYGNRGAFLKIRGAVVHLWHPRSGGAYAVSYPLQKKIEGYSALKPQILLAGHWHRFCRIEERNVHALACPTFQAGRSAFSKSLTGAPAIGGLILSWNVTRDGTLRDFSDEKRSYFEVERPVDVRNQVDGFPVEVPVIEIATKTRRRIHGVER